MLQGAVSKNDLQTATRLLSAIKVCTCPTGCMAWSSTPETLALQLLYIDVIDWPMMCS